MLEKQVVNLLGSSCLGSGPIMTSCEQGNIFPSYIKPMTICKTVDFQRMTVLRRARLYRIRECSLGQYRCLFTRRQIHPNRGVLKHVLCSELYVPLNLRPQQVVQSVLCLRYNFRGSRKRKRMECSNSRL